MANMISTPMRFRRGDTSPERKGLVFFRYARGNEVWISQESMSLKKANSNKIDKKWKSSPAGQKYMREYFRSYNLTPKQKLYHSDYYKREDIKERTKDARKEASRRFSKTQKAKDIWKRSRLKHKDKIRVSARNYRRKKKAENPVFRMELSHRNRIRIALLCQGVRKNSKTVQMLGCSFEYFRGWLEAKFTEGMSWSNYGKGDNKWVVDHVTPIASFNLAEESEKAAAFNYINCAPKWFHENCQKSDKLPNGVRARDIRTIIPFQKAA